MIRPQLLGSSLNLPSRLKNARHGFVMGTKIRATVKRVGNIRHFVEVLKAPTLSCRSLRFNRNRWCVAARTMEPGLPEMKKVARTAFVHCFFLSFVSDYTRSLKLGSGFQPLLCLPPTPLRPGASSLLFVGQNGSAPFNRY